MKSNLSFNSSISYNQSILSGELKPWVPYNIIQLFTYLMLSVTDHGYNNFPLLQCQNACFH